jgi:hypothetical protein
LDKGLYALISDFVFSLNRPTSTQIEDLDVGPIKTRQLSNVIIGYVLFGYTYRMSYIKATIQSYDHSASKIYFPVQCAYLPFFNQYQFLFVKINKATVFHTS